MNFSAREYWTDGWREASLMPNDAGLRRCRCGRLITLGELLEISTATSSDLPVIDHVPDEDLPGCLAQTLAEDVELAARRQLWWCLNHPYRKLYRQHRDAEDAATQAAWEAANPDCRRWWDKVLRREPPRYVRQTEKISTEIRRSVKSTFRTVTETTDMSSKRYVLKNDTDKLINYELRRKMRQVGVQVQDIGTYLCWQAFVDDPGKNLGIAKLVHIAKDPELGAIVPPESVPRPGLHSTQVTIDIPFVPATKDTEPDEDMDEAYRDGVEVNTDTNEGDPERVKWEFSGFRSACDIASYEFRDVEFDYGGQDVRLELGAVDTSMPGEVGFDIKVRHINFRNNPNVRVTAKVNWSPSKKLVDEADGWCRGAAWARTAPTTTTSPTKARRPGWAHRWAGCFSSTATTCATPS